MSQVGDSAIKGKLFCSFTGESQTYRGGISFKTVENRSRFMISGQVVAAWDRLAPDLDHTK